MTSEIKLELPEVKMGITDGKIQAKFVKPIRRDVVVWAPLGVGQSQRMVPFVTADAEDDTEAKFFLEYMELVGMQVAKENTEQLRKWMGIAKEQEVIYHFGGTYNAERKTMGFFPHNRYTTVWLEKQDSKPEKVTLASVVGNPPAAEIAFSVGIKTISFAEMKAPETVPGLEAGPNEKHVLFTPYPNVYSMILKPGKRDEEAEQVKREAVELSRLHVSLTTRPPVKRKLVDVDDDGVKKQKTEEA